MIETKQVQLSGHQNGDKYMRKLYDECHNYIQDMTAFGWQPTQEITESHGGGRGRSTSHYQIMARETSMEHYNELRKLESQYESAKSQIKSYNSMEFTTVLLLLLIFIIPGVIYIAYKTNQKKFINENNQNCRSIMQKAVADARKIK